MNKKKVKKAGMGIIAGMVMLTAAGSSIAYLTQKEQAVNVFTVGDLELGLREPEWNPDDGDGSNMIPGSTVYKNPTIKNIASDKNGGQSSYTRIIVYLRDKNGALITDSERLKLIKEMIRYDSTYSGDYENTGTAQTMEEGRIPGYSLEEIRKLPMVNPLFEQDEKRSEENMLVFNYMGAEKDGIFKTGEEAALFTTLAVPTEWTGAEMELLGEFQLDVVAQAIQASGFAGQEEGFAALDKEDAEDSNV